MCPEQWHSRERVSKKGPPRIRGEPLRSPLRGLHRASSEFVEIWRVPCAMLEPMGVFVMGDLDLAIRGRTYREPDGPHAMVVRGKDFEAGLQHVASRDDCRSVAVVGLPEQVPYLSVLVGRRLLLVDGDSARLRHVAEVAIHAGIEVEWIRAARPPFERLAAALLPVGAIVMAAGSGSRMQGSEKLLLDFDGTPMVRHVMHAASEGGCHQTVVVYSAEDVRAVSTATRRPSSTPTRSRGWPPRCRLACARCGRRSRPPSSCWATSRLSARARWPRCSGSGGARAHGRPSRCRRATATGD